MRCIIGREVGKEQWEENLEVHSLATAENDIREIVKYFNDTLRPGEHKRKFISLVGRTPETDFEKAVETINDWIRDFRLEVQNLYGSVWAKGVFQRVLTAKDKYLETGKDKSLKGYVRKALNYMGDYSEEQKIRLNALLEMDLEKAWKEEVAKGESE